MSNAATARDTRGTGAGIPETPRWLRQANAIGELRDALADLERASTRIARVLRNIHEEDRALLAEPTKLRVVRELSRLVAVTQEAA